MKRIIKAIRNLFSKAGNTPTKIAYDAERACYYLTADEKRTRLYSKEYAARLAKWNCYEVLD